MASNGVSSKPKSMSVGMRNVVRSNDSHSLWNCTLSPGWSREESDLLRKALAFHGIGNWKDIMESGCLPGKTNAQLNLQTQRLLGQQSTAEFQGLHIDPQVIGELNSKKQGDAIKRKNGYIVNTGNKMTREELKQRIAENRVNYGMPEEKWRAITLEKQTDPALLLVEKRAELEALQSELVRVQALIAQRREALQTSSHSTIPSDIGNENLTQLNSASAAKKLKISAVNDDHIKTRQ